MNNGKAYNCKKCNAEGGFICDNMGCKCLYCGFEGKEGEEQEEVEEVKEPIVYYTEKEILEAFEEAINDIWQQGDASYNYGVSKKTNIKKFLEKLKRIKTNKNYDRPNTN